MNKENFLDAAREGMRNYVTPSIGLLPWATATGMALHGSGLSFIESMGMNFIVFGGTAQLGTLPLIISGASYWLIFCTALILNLRFVIFSATLAPAFDGVNKKARWLAGHLLSDGVTAVFSEKIITEKDPARRMGTYFGPSILNWFIWQLFTVIGFIAGSSFPSSWPIGFLATIALISLAIPMIKNTRMIITAITTAISVIILHDLPLRLGFLLAILLGMLSGLCAEKIFE